MSDEERALPPADKNKPNIANPSTPGVQKPGNLPGGRDAPQEGEKRG
jgi:hypothetical protein